VDVRNGGVGEDGSDVEDENCGGDELASVRATVLPVIIVSFSPRLDDSVLDFFFIVFDDDFCIVLSLLNKLCLFLVFGHFLIFYFSFFSKTRIKNCS